MPDDLVQIKQQYYAFAPDFPAFHMDYTQMNELKSELHYHNCMEIGLAISGKGTMIINNTVSSFEKGTVTVMCESCIHDSHIVAQSKSEEASVWKFIFVKPEMLGITQTTDFAGFASNDKRLVALFHLMFSELENEKECGKTLFCGLLFSFLQYSKRIAPKKNAVTPASLSTEMAAAIKMIHARYNAQMTLENMAKSCNMSVSSFCRTFKNYFDVAPITYLNNLRLTVAKQLLETTNTPIVEISSFVGYSSLSSFNRLFMKRFSQPPREIRKRAREAALPNKKSHTEELHEAVSF